MSLLSKRGRDWSVARPQSPEKGKNTFNTAIAGASLSYQRASKGPLVHPGDSEAAFGHDRSFVWWQQLRDPTIDALNELMKSLEITSPQLMCFAET